MSADRATPLFGHLYPLDRFEELQRLGWDEDTLIAEAREAGWIVTRRMVRAWVSQGMLPPPRKPNPAG